MASRVAAAAAQQAEAAWRSGSIIPTMAKPGAFATSVADVLATARAPIPALRADGMLPAGVWAASWGEFLDRFATTPHREGLARRAEEALTEVRISGVADAIIGGSFVTAKAVPGDIDIAVRTELASDPDLMRSVVLNTVHGREQSGVAVYPASMRNANGPHHQTMLDFFMTDRTDAPRGVVLLNLRDVGL